MDGRGRPKRVAVIGSGLAGLTVAYLLSSSEAQDGRRLNVELLERNDALGMDSQSIHVVRGNKQLRVDVPMRAFSEGYYPELTQMYRFLKVRFQNANFSFSFARSTETTEENLRQHGPAPLLVYSGAAAQYALRILPRPSSLWGYMRMYAAVLIASASYLILVLSALYHTYAGHTRDSRHALADMTFNHWCKRKWINERFLTELLLPLLSAIMTADVPAVQNMPAADTLDYIASTFLYQHYTVQDGVSHVVSALTRHISEENIHLGVNITDVLPSSPHQIILRAMDDHDNQLELAPYDHVIFATPTPQSAKFLQQYARHSEHLDANLALRCKQMAAELGKLQYKESTVVCHSDETVLPAEPVYWTDLNLATPLVNEKHALNRPAPTYTMASHVIWKSQPTSPKEAPVIQSTNPLPWLFPRRDAWLSHSVFQRFVLTLGGKTARSHFFYTAPGRWRKNSHIKFRRLGPLQGRMAEGLFNTTIGPGLWVNGSWTFGVPLLEGCVASARLVATAILEMESMPTAHMQEIWA